MKTFVFCSFKGGTAKTSSAIHLGACLSKYHGKKVLLIDLDSQANLSCGLGLGRDSQDTMVEVLQKKKRLEDVIKETSISNLHAIPGNTFLDGIESTSPLVSDLYAHERLRKSISNLNYDYCFIDTPPSLGWLTQSAFFASDHSIICAIPEPYSLLALNRLKDYHESIEVNHSMTCIGVIMSFWDSKGATNKAFLHSINSYFPDLVFNSKIRRDVSVNRAILKGEPVINTSENCRASLDYKFLAREFLFRNLEKLTEGAP